MYKNISVEDEPIRLNKQLSTELNYRLELNSQTAAEQYLLNIHHHLPSIGIHALLLNTQQQLLDTRTLLQETFSISDLTATTITHHCKHRNATRVILAYTHPTQPLTQQDYATLRTNHLKHTLLNHSIWLDDFIELTHHKTNTHKARLTSLAMLGIV
jgi:DNA repair protein RadC